jgi:CheY-like chemotaxis protein
MRRKVLIAEQTDTLRSIAETVLRQNGYDVIAVTAAEKAREVLDLSQPDLIIVGADLVAPDGTLYHERLRQEPKTSGTPVLLFEPAGQSDADFPDEVLIKRPFDPRDFLHKVSVFLGNPTASGQPAAAPSEGTVVDDEFLDAALGLDKLDVTDSEVMDRTVVGRQPKASSGSEKLIGLDTGPNDEVDFGNSTVESLVIDADSSQVRHRKPGRKAPPAAGTGKIEILTDQFGMVDSGPAQEDTGGAHDYDWFVDAIKSDADPATPDTSADSGSLSITDPSSAVDPITAVPATPSATSGGVDHFIDEFKKEMDQVRSSEEDPPVPTEPDPISAEVGEMAWEETMEKIGPAQVDLFMKEFAHEVGRKVAEMMVARIDPDKLLRMIKSEILERQKKSSR